MFKYFSVYGEASRKEFVVSFLATNILWFVGSALLDLSKDWVKIFPVLLLAIVIIYLTTSMAKRLRDAGQPPILAILIPLTIGGTYLPDREILTLLLPFDIPYWLFVIYYHLQPLLKWVTPFGLIAILYSLLAPRRRNNE